MATRDPHTVRIVPPKSFEAEALDRARLAGRQLTYRGGPLLSAVEIFTIFWGAAWQGAQASLVGEINKFFEYIVTSPLMDQLAEYSNADSSNRSRQLCRHADNRKFRARRIDLRRSDPVISDEQSHCGEVV